jgi:hypothetical protein
MILWNNFDSEGRGSGSKKEKNCRINATSAKLYPQNRAINIFAELQPRDGPASSPWTMVATPVAGRRAELPAVKGRLQGRMEYDVKEAPTPGAT